MSSRFERVSRVEIEPNELHAYAKNIGTLNRLSIGILKNFARVSFRFCSVENLQHSNKHFYIQHNQTHFLPTFLRTTTPINICLCSTSSQHSPIDNQQGIQSKGNNIDTQFKRRKQHRSMDRITSNMRLIKFV